MRQALVVKFVQMIITERIKGFGCCSKLVDTQLIAAVAPSIPMLQFLLLLQLCVYIL